MANTVEQYITLENIIGVYSTNYYGLLQFQNSILF